MQKPLIVSSPRAPKPKHTIVKKKSFSTQKLVSAIGKASTHMTMAPGKSTEITTFLIKQEFVHT